jgi:signal transduction histidine kinase
MTGDGVREATYTGGNLVPYDRSRKYVWHTLPLGLDRGNVYCLAAFYDQGKNINAGYKIMTAGDLDALYTGYDRLIWFYLGVVFIILVAVLYGWIIFRNIALGYYTLYILSITAWILGHYGYLYPMLYPGFPALNSIAKPLSISCGLLFFCSLLHSLFKAFLQKDKTSRIMLRCIMWSGMIIPFILIAYFVVPKLPGMPALFNVGWNSYFAVSFVGVLLVLVRLFERSITARLFALALGIMTAMAIQQVLSNSGFFYNYLLNEHGMLLASIAEMLVLTFATFRNIWEDKKRISLHVAQLEDEHFRTLAQLVAVQDNERKRIAGDLHDSIGPMLAAIKINFQRVVKKTPGRAPDTLIAKTEDIIDSSMAEIRNISHQLMPKGLAAKGLAASLSEYIHNLREVYHITIHFKHNITAALNKDVQLNVYRIISELVLNGAKHSKASCISASVETPERNITVVVQDDGQGFDPAQISDAPLGLKNIESRVEYLKGNIQIKSAPGKGTCITIVIPQGVAGT